MRYRPAITLLVIALCGSPAILAFAQEPNSPRVVVVNTTDDLPPISPKTSPGPMSLDACIELGFQHQPALAAAQASLNAAYTGKNGIDKLIIPRLLDKSLGVRSQQACQGVTIAGAALRQAELETRYAVTRNFFTVQYIRSQQIVIADVLQSLDTGYKRAKKIYDAADPNAKITKIDLDMIQLQIALVKGKKAQADNGMDKAKAALREAMGLAYNWPLDIAVVDLPTAVNPVKADKGTVTFVPVYTFDKAALIAAAIANRPEMTQASAASLVTELEIEAQGMGRGWRKGTFAGGADIHAQPIPQGISNGDYRPGAIGMEYPGSFGGRKADRVQRARDLHQRALAVVDKAHNLVSLDVEAQFLKYQEAVEDIKNLREIYDTAQKLPGQVEKLIQGKDLTAMAIIQANMTAIMVRTQLNDEMHLHALALAGLERATAGAFHVYPVPGTAAK